MIRGRTRIAIVGMGASGVMTCIHLIAEMVRKGYTHDVELYLLEKQKFLGAGVAYATTLGDHILNMQAATMSLFPDDPDHFVKWLRQYVKPAMQNLEREYVSRYHYATYLRHCLTESIRQAQKFDLRVVTEQCEVTDCYLNDGRVVLDATTRLPDFSHVVLCVGDLPATTYREFRGHSRYFSSPWDGVIYHGLSNQARVGVLGTSLTAVDTLISLDVANHAGPLFCFSRSRFLPKVQPATLTPYRPRFVTAKKLYEITKENRRKISLSEVLGLFRAELEYGLDASIDWPVILGRHPLTQLSVLQQDIRRAQAGETRWYEVLDATAELAPYLWDSMQHAAKMDFMARFFSTWTMFRHPMPLVNGCRIERLLHRGQLQVISNVKSVLANYRGGFDVNYHTCGGMCKQSVDYLINATGTGFHAWLLDSTLIHNMLSRGLLTAHPLGGIDVDFDTLQIRGNDNRLVEQVFFVGPLTRGVHFYTNSIETNLANTKRLASSIISTFTRESKHI